MSDSSRATRTLSSMSSSASSSSTRLCTSHSTPPPSSAGLPSSFARVASSPLTAGLSAPLTHPLLEQSLLHSLVQQHMRALLPAVLSHSSDVLAANERIALCAADVSDDRRVVAVMSGELCDKLSAAAERWTATRRQWEREVQQQASGTREKAALRDRR